LAGYTEVIGNHVANVHNLRVSREGRDSNHRQRTHYDSYLGVWIAFTTSSNGGAVQV